MWDWTSRKAEVEGLYIQASIRQQYPPWTLSFGRNWFQFLFDKGLLFFFPFLHTNRQTARNRKSTLIYQAKHTRINRDKSRMVVYRQYL